MLPTFLTLILLALQPVCLLYTRAVMESAAAETARLNGYLHAVAALEPKPDSEWLQLTFRFVDKDPQKLDYLSRLIARGTAQKHFVPGA